MKGTKSILLLIVSFLLFAVSFALLWTWGYRVYIKKPGEEPKAGVSTIAAAPASTRDSLQTVYASTINELDDHLVAIANNTDSLKGQLDKKLGEFYRLRNEIAALLKDRETDANLGLAKQKIEALQQKVKELVDKNADVENENRKLAAVLQQLAAGKKTPESNAQRTSYDNAVAAEKNITPTSLSISELRLAAVTTENDREQETTQAQKTEKLVGSFTIKNGSEAGNTSEVMIIVLQPDGQVVKNSAWESGTFITAEGKKVYSYKMRFDNSHEPKRLLFSLSPDNYQKGNYTMQVWYNGTLVGRVMKTLS